MESKPSCPGIVLTWTFSPRIAVWNFMASLKKPYVATYSVSNSNALLCSICNSGPFCITSYQDQIIRVWDIRTLQTVQTIQTKAQLNTPFIHILRDDSFLAANKDVYFYANREKEANRGLLLIPPALIKATFNLYHKILMCISR